MPLLSTIANATARAFGFTMGVVSKIIDTFARVTSGALGTTDTGQLWSAITGVWYANSGVAQTASSPSTYPMAIVEFQPNATLTLKNVAPGGGVVFWEADSGDWWGAATTVAEASEIIGYHCNASACCTGSNTCTYNSCCYGSPYVCVYNSCCTVVFYEGDSQPHCIANSCCSYTSTCAASSCCTGSNTCVASSCCSESATYGNVYNWTLKIIKAVASVISTVASSLLITTSTPTPVGIRSLSVTTTGVDVVATGYSDTGLVTSLSEVSAIASGSPPTARGVGIMLIAVDSTASALQGATVGTFEAT